MSGEIPVPLFKKCDFIFNTVTTCINTTLASGIFPESLKRVNISPIHKTDNPFDKKNYRPASIFLLASKVCERVIYKQTSYYFENFLNEILCGFLKAHRTQHP